MAGGEVSRDEFEALKIRVTVMENAVRQLTEELALLREEMNERFDRVDERFEQFRAEVRADLAEEMRQQLTELQTNLIAALITRKPKGES